MEHTPLPWQAGKQGSIVTQQPDPQNVEITGDAAAETIEWYGGHVICETVTDVNRRYIIEACNHYETLQARVSRLEYTLSRIAATMGRNGHTATNIIEAARQALDIEKTLTEKGA